MRREFQSQRQAQAIRQRKRQNRMLWQISLSIVAVVLVLALIPVAINQCNRNDHDYPEIPGYAATSSVTNHVRMNIHYTDNQGQKQYGSIIVSLDADAAPVTVDNFQRLVREGFYDGLTFHRVMKGFMIQGGDPKGDGTGGSSQKIAGEFLLNGYDNPLSHTRGTISMARGSYSYDSASSQFFIMHEDNAGLDGSYAAFGAVEYGMETVDAIANLNVTYNSGGEKSKPVNSIVIDAAFFVTHS